MIEALLAIPNLHMYAVFGFIIIAVGLFAYEKLSVEMAAMVILSVVMLFFTILPLKNETGELLVNSSELLEGFSNPALIAVMSLLVLGQAIIRTGSLSGITTRIISITRGNKHFAIVTVLFLVICISSFVNDTPTCVMFMPIMMAIAREVGVNASKVMIPLSYASILGGITTLVGSSTNLLVSASLVSLGREPLGIFDFTLPGVVIALVGFLYLVFVIRFLLPNRAPLSSEVLAENGGDRQFVAQLELSPQAEAVGKTIEEARLFADNDITLKMIQRGEHAFLPPFDENLTLRIGDILIITTTRKAITDLLANTPKESYRKIYQMSMAAEDKIGEMQMSEIVVPPASRMIGQNIEQIGFHQRYGVIVLGIQRRSRVITARMTDTRLAAGDVLLVMGNAGDIGSLRNNRDIMLMEWATTDLPSKKLAWRINTIFLTVVIISALEILPIHISAFIGAGVAILSGCLNLRQAMRALDSQIIFMVAAGLALSVTLEKTGGAAYLANNLVDALNGVSPVFIMSALFMLMAITTNVLSNNATALLFTPIAVSTAVALNAPVEMFVFAVIFASNCCSFATPIGYQTNLLVMAPGHYKFTDYIKAGLPLMLLVWATYTAYSWIVYG